MSCRELDANTAVDWAKHAGEYRVAAQDGGPCISILARNGRLYLQVKLHYSQPAVRLRQYRPDVFITPDGKPVRFLNGGLTFSDIAFVKES